MADDIAPAVADKRLRGLLYLAGTAAVFVILAAWALISEANLVAPTFTTQKMFPDLAAQVNDVARLKIVSPDGTFEAVRNADGNWVLPGKAGYPARFESIKRAIVGIAELDLIEAKTARADWHARLNLTPADEGGQGVRYTLEAADGTAIASLIAGKVEQVPSPGADGTIYVRRAGEDQTFLARGFLTVQRSETDWIDKTLFDVAGSRVARADVQPPEGEAYTLARENADAPNFSVSAVPPGRQPAATTIINGLATAISGLTIEDVQAQSALDFSDASRAAFTTFDGLSVVLSIIDHENLFWASIQALHDVDAKPEIVEEAKAINARVAGWAYRLPNYKGAQLRAPQADMLQPLTLQDGSPVPQVSPVPPGGALP